MCHYLLSVWYKRRKKACAHIIICSLRIIQYANDVDIAKKNILLYKEERGSQDLKRLRAFTNIRYIFRVERMIES